MKVLLLIYSLVLIFFLSCRSDASTKKAVGIAMYKNMLVVNQISFTLPATYNDIVSILGTPPKTTYSFNNELVTANYVYEDYGIIVEELNKEIFAINAVFFNPLNPKSKCFTGVFTINDVPLDFNSSIADLDKIPGLIIEEKKSNVYVTKFNNYNVLFEFIDGKKENLKAILVTNKNLKSSLNNKGWSEDNIYRYKKETKETKGFKDFCQERNIDFDKFVNCYTEKMTSTFTMTELENQTKDTKEKTYKVFEECIKQSR